MTVDPRSRQREAFARIAAEAKMRALIQRLHEAYYEGTQGRLSRTDYLAAEADAHAQAAALGYGIRVYGRFPTCQCLSYYRLDSRCPADCEADNCRECMETGKRPVSRPVAAVEPGQMTLIPPMP